MAQRKKKKSKGTGLLIAGVWLLLALIIFVLFLIKRETISENLKRTNFIERVLEKPHAQTDELFTADSGSEGIGADVELPMDRTEAAALGEPEVPEESPSVAASDPQPAHEQLTSPAQPEPAADTVKAPQREPERVQSASSSAPEKPAASAGTEAAAIPMTAVELYFVTIDNDGSVNRKPVTRSLPRSNSPLTNALRTLFDGPNASERSAQYRTLIPAGTRLLGVSVRDGIATINLSEEFEFNQYGVEGYTAQLMQIVYTATAFSTVQSVQFIINGERKEFLSGDGQWIGSPLSRASFK